MFHTANTKLVAKFILFSVSSITQPGLLCFSVDDYISIFSTNCIGKLFYYTGRLKSKSFSKFLKKLPFADFPNLGFGYVMCGTEATLNDFINYSEALASDIDVFKTAGMIMPWKRKVEIIAAYLWSPYQYIKSKYAGYEDYLRNDWCFSRIKLGGLKAKDIREGFLDHMDEMKIQRLKIKDLMKDFEVKPESDYYRNVYELVYLPSLNQYALLAYTTCGTKIAGYVLLLFTKKLKTALWLAPMLMHFKDEKIHPGEVMFFMADKESVVIEHFGIECKPKLILKDVKNAKHSLILRAEKVLKPDWSPKKND